MIYLIIVKLVCSNLWYLILCLLLYYANGCLEVVATWYIRESVIKCWMVLSFLYENLLNFRAAVSVLNYSCTLLYHHGCMSNPFMRRASLRGSILICVTCGMTR